jgi:DNA repair protein RadC
MENGIKASQINNVAEVELIYKTKVKASQMLKITSSKDVYETLLAGWDENLIDFLEQFKIILVNRASKVLGVYEVSKGGMSAVTVDVKVVFIAALKAGASGLILAHNHPSGQLRPSEADKQLTERIREAGKILDILILDHLIVTSEGYYSFVDQLLM